MSQTAISILSMAYCDAPLESFKRPMEQVITSEILPSDKPQTVSLKPYTTPRGVHFPELEIGPSDTHIPSGSVIAIRPSGNTIIGHRPETIPISGYMVNGLKPLTKGKQSLWTIASNSGNHLIVRMDHKVARFDGVSPNQEFPYWWDKGSLIVLAADAKSVIGWYGDFVVIDSVPPSAR